MFVLRLVTLTLLLLAQIATADDQQDDRYIKFTITYEGTPSTGEFTDFVAKASLTPEQLDSACLDVKINTISADIGSEDLNAELPGPDWFAAIEHPRAHFFSNTIRLYPESDSYQYVAEGELTLKDNTESVSLPFNWEQTDNTAVLSGQTEVSRLDFDIGSGEWADTNAIGETVVLDYSTRFRWNEGMEGAPCPIEAPELKTDPKAEVVSGHSAEGTEIMDRTAPDVPDLPDPEVMTEQPNSEPEPQ